MSFSRFDCCFSVFPSSKVFQKAWGTSYVSLIVLSYGVYILVWELARYIMSRGYFELGSQYSRNCRFQEVLGWFHSGRSGAKIFPVGLCLAYPTSFWPLFLLPVPFQCLMLLAHTHSVFLSATKFLLCDSEPTLVQFWAHRSGFSCFS